jgi:cob(I)alamin adenosyltransferase
LQEINLEMKIYTKTGDSGETSLIGGTRVPKHHIKIEAYGTVDELNSYIGLVRDTFDDLHSRDILYRIQNNLFVIGSHLAEDRTVSKMQLPKIEEAEIVLLETEMDAMNVVLPELKFFILPGGYATASYAHIARCVCRRAERCATHLAQLEEVESDIIKYLNRLSDYLFVLARYIAFKNGAEEVKWQVR